eukprot:s1430_g2.t1
MCSLRVLHRPHVSEDVKLDAVLDPKARGSKIKRSKNGSSVLKSCRVGRATATTGSKGLGTSPGSILCTLTTGLTTPTETCLVYDGCSKLFDIYVQPAAAAGAGSRYTHDPEEPEPECDEALESEELEDDETTDDGASGLTFLSDQVALTADYFDYVSVSSEGCNAAAPDPTTSGSSTVALGFTMAAPAANDEADDAADTLTRPADDPARDVDDDEGPWDV